MKKIFLALTSLGLLSGCIGLGYDPYAYGGYAGQVGYVDYDNCPVGYARTYGPGGYRSNCRLIQGSTYGRGNFYGDQPRQGGRSPHYRQNDERRYGDGNDRARGNWDGNRRAGAYHEGRSRNDRRYVERSEVHDRHRGDESRRVVRRSRVDRNNRRGPRGR